MVDVLGSKVAHCVWSYNNGNPIDKAPNGADSIFFKTLLNLYGGDRKKAIEAKANTYKNKFFNWFGDWTRSRNVEIDKEIKKQISLIFKNN